MKQLGLISLDQRSIYEERLAQYPTELSEHTFTNLFMWRKSSPIQAIDVSDTLILYKQTKQGAVVFGPPIGPLSLSDAAYHIQSKTGIPIVALERISEKAANSSLPPGWSSKEDQDYHDYVYRRDDLASLAGRRYHKKRNLVAQCLENHDCVYEEISDNNIDEVRTNMNKWCKERNCKENQELCPEYIASMEILKNFNALNVTGAAIRIEGNIEAFTVGERLNTNTAVIHLEKAMPQFKGLYQVINQWYCKNNLNDFEFVNREQDVGVEGLRKAKQSYLPHHMIKKFIVYPEGFKSFDIRKVRFEKRCPEEMD